MSDEEETALDVAKKFQAFFAKRKADNPCPFCGNPTWVSLWPEKREPVNGIRAGGGDDSGDMEARVAVLEQIAKQTEAVLERMDRRLERLEDRQRTDFLRLLGVTLGGFAGMFGLMAHGFHWF